MNLTKFGVTPAELMNDVYFREDFARVHARGGSVDSLKLDGFSHVAVAREIPPDGFEDLETAWGYGGPVAVDHDKLAAGLEAWRERQIERGRIAEFIRFHPFMNVEAYADLFDRVTLDRHTILVDLKKPLDSRWKSYSKGTRYSIRKAREALGFRELTEQDAAEFHALYTAGLERNASDGRYHVSAEACRELLSADWLRAWSATLSGEPVAVACFLQSGPFVHYHLSGGTPAARDCFAHYGLLENAIDHYHDGEVAKFLHLGGGRSSAEDDALLAFKKNFSREFVPFFIGGLVHDRERYAQLSNPDDPRFLSYRFTG